MNSSMSRFLRRLVASANVPAACQAGVEVIVENLGVPVSWCSVRRGELLTVAAHHGLRTGEMTNLWRLRVGEGVGGDAVKERTTQVSGDYPSDPRYAARHDPNTEELRTLIAAPLVIGDRALGVICAAERQSRQWEPDEVAFVTDVARDVAVALARIEERLGNQSRLERAERVASMVRRNLEMVTAIAAELAESAEPATALGVLGHHLGAAVEIADSAGCTLFSVSHPTRESGGPVYTEPLDAGSLGMLRIMRGRSLQADEIGAVRTSARLFELALQRRREAARTENRLRADLLSALVIGSAEPAAVVAPPVESVDPAAMHLQALLLGVDLTAPRYVARLGYLAAEGLEAAGFASRILRLRERLSQRLERVCPGSFVTQVGRDIALLIPAASVDLATAERTLADLLVRLGDDGSKTAIGLGRRCQSASEYRAAFSEATLALNLARRRQEAKVLCWTDLGFYGLAGAAAADERLRSLVQSVLGPVVASDQETGTEYVKSLWSYFSHDRHLERTARTLHVHPNTVRYRVAKAESLLGVDLHDPEQRFLLEFALRVNDAVS